MKARFLLLLTFVLFIVAANAAAETVAGLPLHVEKLKPGVIRVWIGDHISSTNTIAFATEDGILVVDTFGDPVVDRELRKAIARELGRDDFKYLINTHEHGDHTGGNAVYADCTIVGHDLVAAGMVRSPEARQRTIDWRTDRVAELEAQIAGLADDVPEAGRLKEDLVINKLLLKAAHTSSNPSPPTKTFTDRLDLDLGDTSFELYYIGGMHSASDIAIFVPEHGLLMTGDTMADTWLTDTPGCLASFIARSGVEHDFPRLLKNWNTLVGKKDSIERLVPGHWNGELSFAGFENRVNYIAALWEGTNQAAEANTNLEQLFADLRLDTRFPELVDSPGCSQGNNYTTIMEMWSIVSDQESAAQALYTLIDEGAVESAIARVVAQKDAASPTHYFLESQINGWGYRFIGEEKFEKAATMFKVNVELFPESWNVYDSYGEALLAAGDTETAIAMYERSIELNPENTHGKEVLERARETGSVN